MKKLDTWFFIFGWIIYILAKLAYSFEIIERSKFVFFCGVGSGLLIAALVIITFYSDGIDIPF